MTAGGVAGGTFIDAPWQDAVSNAESVIVASAAVEEGDIKIEASGVDGVFHAGSTVAIVPRTSPDRPIATVTSVAVAPGDVLASGDALANVSGRPVLALDLPFSLYRDLHMGDQGDDVAAIQEAMRSGGWYSGRVDGSFGPGTAAAIAAMYSGAGAAIPPVDNELVDADREAKAALDHAKSEPSANGDPAAAPVPPDPSVIAQAEVEYAEAHAAAGPWLPMSEIVAIPSPEVVVTSVVPVGSELGAEATAIARAQFGRPHITSRVSVAAAPGFSVGGRVVISTPDGTSASGVIASVSEFQEPDEETPDLVPGYDVDISLESDPHWPDQASVQVLPEGVNISHSGLIVPLTAIRRSDGEIYVLVRGQRTDGRDAKRVSVTQTATGDGRAIVEGALAAGDHVIVAGIQS